MRTLKEVVFDEAKRLNEFARANGLDLLLVVKGKGIAHRSAYVVDVVHGYKLIDESRRLDAELIDKLMLKRMAGQNE